MTREELINEDWGKEYSKLADLYAKKCKEVRELKEKNKQIKAEVIEEVKGLAQHYLIDSMDLENATKYGNKNAKQQDISYGTLMRYEIADCVDDFMDSVEGLKENK